MTGADWQLKETKNVRISTRPPTCPLLHHKRLCNSCYRPFETQEEIDEALRFALSQDVTATTAGDLRLAAMMIDSTEGFALTNEEEQRAFVSKVTLYKPLFRADFIH
jgi:hypothetical protein